MRQSQTIFRITKNKKHPYVMIDRSALMDENLSWKAKGILAYLLSLPDDWVLYLSELSKHATNGKESLYTGIQELIKKRYLTRSAIRNKKGQMKGYEYSVFEKPYRQNPDTGNPDTGNPPLLINNKRISNNKKVASKLNDTSFGIKTPKKTFYDKCTIKLIKLLQSKRKIMRKPNLKQWANQFKILNTIDGVKKKDIKKVLEWYCHHIGEHRVPDPRSAKTFRERFDPMLAAMERYDKQIEKGEQPITCRKIKRKTK